MAVKPGGAWWILGMGAIATYGDSPKFPNADPIALGSLLLTPGSNFVSLSWLPASPRPGVPPAAAYSVELVNTGETVVTPDTFYTWENLELDTLYTFRVRSLTELGIASDYQEGTVRTLNINEITSAIGETTDFVKNVNGVEETWRLWTWDGAGLDGEGTASFNVVTSVNDFHVLLLGMGGPARGDTGSGGGGGGWIEAIVTPDEMPAGTYDFTLGKYYIRSDNLWQHTVNVSSVLTIGDTVFTTTRGGEGGVKNAGSNGGGGGGGSASVTGSIANVSSGNGGKGGNAWGGYGSEGHYSEISGEKVDYCGGGGAGNYSATAGSAAYGGRGWDSSLIDQWSSSGGYGANHGGGTQVGEIGRRGLRGGGAGGSSFYQHKYQPGSNGMLMIAYKID